MKDYTDKLTQLISKTKLLETRKEHLITQRKNEIAKLADAYGLLTVSDNMLAGAFSEIYEAVKLNSHKIKQWEGIGLKNFTHSKQKRLELLSQENIRSDSTAS